MAAQANLTIATRGTVNGAATASVTYNSVYASVPEKAAGGTELVTRWEDRTAATAIGYSTLVVRSRPADGKGLQQNKLRLSIPTLEAPASGGIYTPVPKVAYTCDFKGDFILPSRATTAEKWECYARAVSALGQAFLLAMAKDNEQVN